jgi:hypothetical protein
MSSGGVCVLLGLGGLLVAGCGSKADAVAGTMPAQDEVASTRAEAVNTGPSVTGGGAGPFVAGPFLGDRVQLELNARMLADVAAGGEFDFVHHFANSVGAHLHGSVDCVSATGNTAIITGTITAGFDFLGVPPEGTRVSFTVVEDTPDSFGFDLSFISGHPIPACTSTPLFTVPVLTGGFTIRD